MSPDIGRNSHFVFLLSIRINQIRKPVNERQKPDKRQKNLVLCKTFTGKCSVNNVHQLPVISSLDMLMSSIGVQLCSSN